MAKTLKLGRGLTLPLDAITETIGIVGQRGSGKTHTSGVCMEQALHAGQQAVIVDPLDVWWGLRSSADGKRSGIPITILGGEHGDVPIGEHDGATIAELVVNTGVSVIICLEHLSKAAQRRFMAAFARKLYRLNKEAMHLVIDEADIFAPQKIIKGDEGAGQCKGAVDDLVRRGRAKGIGVTLITQRPAVIDKDVLSQVSMLIAHRLTGPQDQDAIWTWVKWNADETRGKKMMQGLAKLKTGRCWVYSPSWLDLYGEYGINKKTTFDSSQTPKVGQRRRKPKKMAQVDLKALERKLAKTIEDAADKNPAKLRARIKELERALEKKPKRAAPVRPAITRKQQEALLREVRDAKREVLERVKSNLDELDVDVQNITDAWMRENATKPAQDDPVEKPKSFGDPGTADLKDTGLRKGARRMLIALASVGHDLTRRQMAMLSGMKHTSGTFSTYLHDLRKAGLIDDIGNNIEITDAGSAAAGNPPPPSRDELIAIFRQPLRAGARKMFDAVLSEPGIWSREDLANHCELSASSGTFSTYLGDLKRTGLILVDKDGARVNPDLDDLAA